MKHDPEQLLQEAESLQNQGRLQETIDLLKPAFDDAQNDGLRTLYAVMIASCMAALPEFVESPSAEWESGLRQYALFAAETFPHLGEEVQAQLRESFDALDSLFEIARGIDQPFRNLMRARYFVQRDQNAKAYLMLKAILERPLNNRVRLFAAGLLSLIILQHHSELPESQAGLERDLLQYTKIAVACYDNGDEGDRMAFIAWSGGHINNIRLGMIFPKNPGTR